MKKGIGRRKILIPVVAVLLVMTAAFILISFHTFRQYEIRDLEDYSKGLTGLIAGDMLRTFMSVSPYTAALMASTSMPRPIWKESVSSLRP